jgi:glycosyltransferase involved in cell wall biosynthesis
MIIITDLLKLPIDEGAKKTVLNILIHLKKRVNCYIFAINSTSCFSLIDEIIIVNRLLISIRLISRLKKIPDNKVLYIPESSLTLATFFRAFLLNVLANKKIFILALQPRKYSTLGRYIVKYLQPECVIIQSREYSDYLSKLGITNCILPLGVDLEKFQPVTTVIKNRLRIKHGIDINKPVILHVGHIKETRNIKWLIEIKKELPDHEIIIVGSTYSNHDAYLLQQISRTGIRIFDTFLPDIQEIYNLSDYYIFPVERYDAAIGTPLSVLEAMACNLKIFTTRFGSLPDFFNSDNSLYYISSSREIISLLKRDKANVVNNQSKVLSFSWDNIAKQLLDMIAGEIIC